MKWSEYGTNTTFCTIAAIFGVSKYTDNNQNIQFQEKIVE